LATRVKLIDSNTGEPADVIDDISGVLSTIAVEHANIHKGVLFSLLHKVDITAGSTAYIQLKTGSKTVHFKPTNIATDADKFAVEFLEDPTLTDGTTPITLINRNRTSSNTPEIAAYSNPTGVSGGTKIDEFYVGGTVGQKIVGGDVIAGVNEFVLKPNTDYIYKITNEGTSDGAVMIRMFFYEI